MEQEQPELNLSDPIRPTMGPQLHELTLGYASMMRQAETYRRAAAQLVAERDAALKEVDRLTKENEALKRDNHNHDDATLHPPAEKNGRIESVKV